MNREQTIQDRQLQRLILSKEAYYDETVHLRAKLSFWRWCAFWMFVALIVVTAISTKGSEFHTANPLDPTGYPTHKRAESVTVCAVGSFSRTPGPTAILSASKVNGLGMHKPHGCGLADSFEQ